MAISRIVPRRRRERKEPVRREEGDPLAVWQRDMDAMFDEFYRGFGLARLGNFESQLDAFSPRVDVINSDKELKIKAELPGLGAEDVDISVSRDVLTISGEKHEETEDRGKDYYRMERSYGSFRRSVQLPCEVDPDQADAAFEKGVLTVTMPKTRTEECRRIPVKVK